MNSLLNPANAAATTTMLHYLCCTGSTVGMAHGYDTTLAGWPMLDFSLIFLYAVSLR